MSVRKVCPECGGHKVILEEICETCKGKGDVPDVQETQPLLPGENKQETGIHLPY